MSFRHTVVVKEYHRYSLKNIDAENVLAEELENLVLQRYFHSQQYHKCAEKHCPNFKNQQSVPSVHKCKDVCNHNNCQCARIDDVVFHQQLFNCVLEVAVPKSEWEKDDCIVAKTGSSDFFQSPHNSNAECRQNDNRHNFECFALIEFLWQKRNHNSDVHHEYCKNVPTRIAYSFPSGQCNKKLFGCVRTVDYISEHKKQQNRQIVVQQQVRKPFCCNGLDIGKLLFLYAFHHSESRVEQKHCHHHLVEMVLHCNIRFVINSAEFNISLAVAQQNECNKYAFDCQRAVGRNIIFVEFARFAYFHLVENQQQKNEYKKYHINFHSLSGYK